MFHTNPLNKILAGGGMLFFILPRLAGGAHWLSDIIVGGAPIAAMSLTLMYCTPLQSYLARKSEKLSGWILDKIPQRLLRQCPGRLG